VGKLLTWPAEKTVETYLYVFNRDIKPGSSFFQKSGTALSFPYPVSSVQVDTSSGPLCQPRKRIGRFSSSG
jgi:hypothetical protein